MGMFEFFLHCLYKIYIDKQNMFSVIFHSCIFKYLSGRTDRQIKVLKYGRTERQMDSSNHCSTNGDTLTFQAEQIRQRGLGHLIGTHWLVRPHRVRLVKVKMSHPQDWFYWGPRTDR